MMGFGQAVFAVKGSGQAKDIFYPHSVIKHGFRGHVSNSGQNLNMIFQDILFKNPGVARGWRNQTEQGADRRTFSRTVGADKAKNIPCFDRKIHVDDSAGFTVVFGQIFCLNNFHLASPFTGFSWQKDVDSSCISRQ